MKSKYIGFFFFVVYIFSISSIASPAAISISYGGLFLYTLYLIKQKKWQIPLPDKNFQIPWWTFFIAIGIASICLGDKKSILLALDYFYLSIPFWLLLFYYFYDGNKTLFVLSIAVSIAVISSFSLYEFVVINQFSSERVGGLFANKNGYATLLALSIPFLIMLMVDYTKKRTKKNYLIAFLLLVSGVMGMVALILTGSRGGMMGFLAGCVVLLVVRLIFTPFSVKTLVTGIVVCSVIWFGFSQFRGDFERDYDHERVLLSESSYAMWQDHQGIGVGLANWKESYDNKYMLPEATEKNLGMPHNTIAFFFSTTGAIGGCAFLFFTVGIFVFLCNQLRKQPDNYVLQAMVWAFVAVTVHGLVDAGLTMRTALRLCTAYMGVTVASILIYEHKDVKKME